MALRNPGVHVAAVTVVSGNVPLAQACRNALLTAESCGSDVAVFAGADRPLVRKAEHAEWFHGADGLGDQDYPAPRKRLEAGHAVDAIIDAARAHPGLTLVTLGPLTNIALALERDPSLVERIGRCVVMGGNPCCEGNVTPAAEYNIWVDPEAARIVFGSGMRIAMVGWQLCRGVANVNESEIAQIRALDTPLARFAIDCNRRAIEANRIQTGEIGIPLPDPTAMAIALEPGCCTRSSRHRVAIETTSDLTRGMTVVDVLNVCGDDRNAGCWSGFLAGEASICWELDVPRFKRMLMDALR